MSYQDKSKIVAADYEVYIAARTSSSPVTLPLQSVVDAGGDSTWIPVGAYKQGDLKYEAPPNGITLQGSQSHQLAVDAKLEIKLVQTDGAKYTAMEAFVNKEVDILCRQIGSYAYKVYKNFGVMVGSEDPNSVKDADKITLTATASASLASDLRASGTLADS
jgi:hypothetical protein